MDGQRENLVGGRETEIWQLCPPARKAGRRDRKLKYISTPRIAGFSSNPFLVVRSIGQNTQEGRGSSVVEN